MGSRITAMFIATIILLVLAVGMALKSIPQDGYGTRPGPRSHVDPFEPRHHLI